MEMEKIYNPPESFIQGIVNIKFCTFLPWQSKCKMYQQIYTHRIDNAIGNIRFNKLRETGIQ